MPAYVIMFKARVEQSDNFKLQALYAFLDYYFIKEVGAVALLLQ